DEAALRAALGSSRALKSGRQPLTPADYLNLTADCARYRARRRFMQVALSEEEAAFPLAFSMVIHDQLELFERLLRALYAPQNVYCVHVDAKAPADFLQAVRALAACFPNVFVASRLERVVYASWSRLQADLNCMEDLLRRPEPWRYLLNTCGTDFPLKTNAEIVRALQVLRGRNNMESEQPSAIKRQRWRYQHQVSETGTVVRTSVTKSPPPLGSAEMFTGNAYIVVTRDFVRHVLESPEAQRLLAWAQDTYSPDEHVWATLQRLPGVPGSLPPNNKYQLSDMNALARLVKWQYLEGDIMRGAPYPPCTGTHRHAICIYGLGDLPWMLQQQHLLANKFDLSVDEQAVQCLEEHLRHQALFGPGS
ncbi:PREDICTED: beta-1,3-galactosyl-O-glycosyl-glycoprotein beta-1,6-N-acetylglucosaminyltransferase 3, partial [Crocodylus porosus]|uniref:beta-1,3-galactosyl-O-glycosyl-glycoprotein beta-1,6-N-acetylglucosaminyltransferase 3 n=1 Tax=Crocodylus porosus TaxID=8502 RepID=UPI000939EC7F